MQYERDGNYLAHRVPIDSGHQLLLRATNVRQERTGGHARLEILLNGATLAWGQINFEKDEDRVRISNSAYKHIATSQLRATLPPEHFKYTLDTFCAGLWEQQLAELQPVMFAGSSLPIPTSFIVDPYIVEGGGSILFGPPGKGKSWIMIILAVVINMGLHFPYFAPRKRKAVFLNIERSAQSVANRLGAVNAALGLPANNAIPVLNARGKSLADILPSTRAYVEKHDIDVVLLDSISRSGFGDLNENTAANKIVDAMNGLAPSWLGLAHTPRADTTHAYGSVHFDAGADVMINLLSQQDGAGPLGIGLKVEKKNDFGAKLMRIIALDFNNLGLTRVRYADPGEFPEVEQQRKQGTKHDLRQLILDEGPQSATSAAEKLSANRSYISQLLSSDPQFQPVRRDGPAVLYGIASGY